MQPEDLTDLIEQHGFERVRQNRHQVFKRADGATFVMPSTPSDVRWLQNAIADFARVVGKSRKELTARQLPLRAVRTHGQLEPQQSEPALPLVSEMVEPERSKPLDARERKLLKRLERYAANHRAKEKRQRDALANHMARARKLLVKLLAAGDADAGLGAAITVARAMVREGYGGIDVIFCTVDGSTIADDRSFLCVPAIRVGKLYLDWSANEIHDSGQWVTAAGHAIEAVITLRDYVELELEAKRSEPKDKEAA